MHCCWWDEDLDLCKPLNASQQGSTVLHAQVLKLCWCDNLWVNMLQSMVFFREYYLKVTRVQLVFGDCVLLAVQLTTPTFVTHCSFETLQDCISLV
jgi:hypothetical protein